ncbi:MAG: hypothetical protein B6244_10855 [Candidatus Cloacimonetes bacterium 4572_55]|nr:MAG: hypothetical protein B6244_10855 [Candidatus Cloacimonetes bacterium 4572_55]
MKKYQRLAFLGIIVTALGIVLGIVFTTTLKDTVGTLGIVFIGIGGFLLVAGMSEKKRSEGSDDD